MEESVKDRFNALPIPAFSWTD